MTDDEIQAIEVRARAGREVQTQIKKWKDWQKQLLSTVSINMYVPSRVVGGPAILMDPTPWNEGSSLESFREAAINAIDLIVQEKIKELEKQFLEL